jgi:hypothetical protein
MVIAGIEENCRTRKAEMNEEVSVPIEAQAKAPIDAVLALSAERIPVPESGVVARCVLCYGLPGNPGDCAHGDRYAIQFGSHGGVVLCQRALQRLAELTHPHLERPAATIEGLEALLKSEDKTPVEILPDGSVRTKIPETEFSDSQPVGEG